MNRLVSSVVATLALNTGEAAQTATGASQTRADETTLAQADTQAQLSSGIARTSDPRNLGDIIVTARRQEENIQTVPVSVTAFGSETLVSRGVTSTTDIQRIVPGVIFVGAGSDRKSTRLKSSH